MRHDNKSMEIKLNFGFSVKALEKWINSLEMSDADMHNGSLGLHSGPEDGSRHRTLNVELSFEEKKTYWKSFDLILV